METEYTYVNPDDVMYWKHIYFIQVHSAGAYKIYADNLQEALDYLIDYWEEQKWEGMFLSDDELVEEEYPDELLQGGNHGRYTSIGYHEIHVEEYRNTAF